MLPMMVRNGGTSARKVSFPFKPASFLLLSLLLHVPLASAFSLVLSSSSAVAGAATTPSTDAATTTATPLLQTVAVAGATGRTGRLVVEELVQRNISVVALVRNLEKAQEVLPSSSESSSIRVVSCDLDVESQIQQSVVDCDAVIWCATGFSEAPGNSTQQSIDAVGVPALARSFLKKDSTKTEITDFHSSSCPKVVMLSSAGVTRPSWDEKKKKRLEGAADIPIVRLNPFGILGIKAASEDTLRESGVDYCVVRPCGLNDDWPVGSRPVFSQGDVAVGRINRRDVATVLVDVLTCPAAVDKTFEVCTVKDYSPARDGVDRALDRLWSDQQLRNSDEAATVEAMTTLTYGMMQQLLPGETQDSAALAMGQTYEQLDQGETGRLGERGSEDAEAAAPKPTSKWWNVSRVWRSRRG